MTKTVQHDLPLRFFHKEMQITLCKILKEQFVHLFSISIYQQLSAKENKRNGDILMVP